MINDPRPYQAEIYWKAVNSAWNGKGLTLSVEMARQGGKNEISAQIEATLLLSLAWDRWNTVKCAPTLEPQGGISLDRLKGLLTERGVRDYFTVEANHIIRVGRARTIFLSAEDSASVVGHTAHFLEVDEAQDVSKEKFYKDFRPMGAATNATTVLYGTPWDDSTLLEEVKQNNLELERRDGIKRHFRRDWEAVAAYNPDYLTYVESERLRLGEDHPLFLTQYRLLPIHGGGRLFSAQQRAQMQGHHQRLHVPEPGKHYVAGLDLAGEETNDALLKSPSPRRDSTALTIGEVRYGAGSKEPKILIVEHCYWTGKQHTELFKILADILGRVWRCQRVVVDSTGLGQPVASFLRGALGSKITPFVFTQASKSALGFNLLAAVNSGRLRMYAGDGSDECAAFWREMELAKAVYRPNKSLNFYVEAERGHDDLLMSLALAVEASKDAAPRTARGFVRE